MAKAILILSYDDDDYKWWHTQLRAKNEVLVYNLLSVVSLYTVCGQRNK